MVRSFATYTAATFIYFASWLLALSGMLFNWLIANTIVSFTNIYTTSVQTAVEQGWTALRDIANILMIGMFTFIAVSLIIGLKDYGQKKLIARVLIIAVLINFSLLFTKIIIDVSNFTAGQIYSAAALGPGGAAYSAGGVINPSDTANNNSSTASAGIAGNFIRLLGVESFGATQKALDKITEMSGSITIVLLHGVFVLVILLGAALVLLYGSFLLVSRMILLIFIMLTASVAFASYLVPAWAGSSYGWSTWWSSLLKSAALAPVMMVLLWITLNVSVAIHEKNPGSFGNMITDPTNGPNIGTLVNYLIILGLLFISFKLSSKLAGKISGFSMAALVPGIGLGLTGALAGFAGRNLIGRPMRAARQSMRENAWAEGNVFQRSAVGIANRLARTTYNPLKPKPVAEKAKTYFGVPGLLAGKDAYGAMSQEDKMKEKAKRADEVARQLGVTETGRQRITQRSEREARTRFEQQSRQMDDLIRQQTETRDQLAGTFRQQQAGRPQAEESHRNAQNNLAEAESARRLMQEEHANQVRDAESREARGVGPQGQAAAVRARHQQEMASAEERIRVAREEVNSRQQVVDQLDQEARNYASGHEQVTRFNAAITQAQQNLTAMGGSADEAGRRGRQATTERLDPVRLRRKLLWDKGAAGDLSGAMREHQASENWRHIREAFQPERAAQAPAAAPPAGDNPPAAGGAPGAR